ncbi:xylulokinase [Celeribacter sp. ULVN23_4]
MAFLGIDLGTSGLRVLLTDGEGNILASAERSYASVHPAPGWSEQAPDIWIEKLEEAIAELRARAPEFADLKGIGVAGHMHGAVLLDDDDKVLRPCILWNDTRSHIEAARLDAIPGFREITGNIVFPGFTAPKLAWVRQHEPHIFSRIAKVLLPTAYLNLYLTGDHVADMSDSAGTSWLDVAGRDWSERLLAATELDRSFMPRLVEGSAAAGQLREELAQKWGLTSEVTVAGGAGDNAAAACGIGALNEGEGFVSLGTSGVLLVARDACHPAPETALHTFCHAVPDRWYQMGVMLAATDSLNWFSKITGQSPAALTGALPDQLQPPSSIRFLPYLSGERTPHNDAHIRGGFTGLATQSERVDLTQAILEGVAFGLRDSFEALKTTGARAERLFVIGGGTASHYWLQLIATVLDIPLLKPKGGEFGAALGAARLAHMAATGDAPEDVLLAPEACEVIEPVRALTQAFDEAFRKFQASYPALREIQ